MIRKATRKRTRMENRRVRKQKITTQKRKKGRKRRTEI
jgi:hypothetical protein